MKLGIIEKFIHSNNKMSDGKKKMNEFKKLWDKGKMNFKKIFTIFPLNYYSNFSWFNTGLAVQLQNPDKMTEKCLRIRQEFESLSNRNPGHARKVLENPTVKYAQKVLEKAVRNMEKAIQDKESK